MSQQQQGTTTTPSTISPHTTQPPANPLLTLPGLVNANDRNAHGDVDDTPRPWWRRRGGIIGIAIALLIILIGAFLISQLNRKAPITYQYQKPTQGDLAITVSATGPLQSSTYNLSFQGTSAKITEIDVKVGQKVSKDQVLALVDKTALQDAVNSAQASVDSAQTSLGSAIAAVGSAQASTDANVTAAKTALAGSQASAGNTQDTSQTTVASAQTTLDNAQTNLENVQNVAQAQITQAEHQRQQDLAACDNPGGGGAAGGGGGATTTSGRSSTMGSSAHNGETSRTAGIGDLDVTPVVTPPSTGATAVATGPAAPPPAATTPAPVATTAPAPTATAPVNCRALANDRYNQTVANANSSVTQAQASVNSAQSALDQANANANASNQTAQNQVNTNANQVNTAQTGSGTTSANSQVATAQGQLRTAEVQLATAQHNLDNATLKAPHDGIVTVINGTIGGVPGTPANASSSGSTAAGSGSFIQIVDLSSLQVQANVNESDTANLHEGQPVVFTVNAYGDRQFKGKVSAIAPNGTTTQNVVTYPVYIDVDKDSAQGANLLPNMTANVTITVVQHHNAQLIPVNAINFARLSTASGTASTAQQLISRQQANTALNQARSMLGDLESQHPDLSLQNPIPAYVIERSDTTFVARPVVLGLTDGTSYEVLKGLSPDETFIVGTQAPGQSGAGPNGGPGGGGNKGG